jgi:NAD-dependent DNA ligase
MEDSMNYRSKEVKDRNIDELLGISRGLIADDKINQAEVEFLLDWIEKHFNSVELNSYPVNNIYDRLKRVLEDNLLDEDEAEEIKELLKSFTGGKPITEQIKSMSSTLPLSNPLPTVSIENKIFCFTGTFTIGTRSQCEILIKELGGTTTKSPSGKTDYLVIGILGSDDWIHSSYGRKIESAVEYRDNKNTGIKIITEEHFIKFL